MCHFFYTNSLSKWSNYLWNFGYIVAVKIWLCVEKKTKVLQVSVKKSNTLNYLIFWYIFEYKIFCHLFFQNLAILGFVLQSNQKANHSQMYKKMTMFKKILCPKSIHYKSLLACPKGPTIQAVSVKWHPRTFVPKIYLQFGKVFKHLWNFGYVQDKFYCPEISKKN